MGKTTQPSVMLIDIGKKPNSVELKQINCFSIRFIQSPGENIEIDS